MKALVAGLALIIGMNAPAFAAKELYKWVDEHGKIHYSDTVPAEYARQGNKEMTRSGRVVKETPPALTPEQVKARAEAEAKAQDDKKKAEEAARRDKALLASFTTIEELNLAEKRNLEQMDVQILSHELRIKSVQGRLDGFRKQEAGILSRKRPVPPDLAADIKRSEDEINHMRGAIADLQREKEAIRGRYAADRVRYMELKGLAAAASKNEGTKKP